MTAVRELMFPNAVEEADDFFDRAEPVAEIRDALLRPARRTMVILGGRLIGKTSLLNVIAHWAEGQASFAVVRLAHAGSRENLMAEIAHGVQERAGGDAADLLDPNGTFGTTTVASFVRIIQRLTAQAPELRFLLYIDELDSLLQGCDGQEARLILDLILHLTEHTKLPIRFLFTMSRIPEQVQRSYGSPFLNQATIIELRPWSAAESHEFIDWLVGDRLELDENAHGALFDAAGGHPYFTKAVLKALLNARRVDPAGRRPSSAEITSAIQSAARSRLVDVALSNIAEVYLPRGAVAVLDRAAVNPAGIAVRDVRELAVPDGALHALTESGLLTREDRQYVLRLGLWRQWRTAARLAGAHRTGPLVRLGRATQRLVAGRVLKVTLLAWLVVLLAALAVGTAFLIPTASFTVAQCAGAASGLQVRVSHPSFVSTGDEQSLQVTVVNDGGTSDVVDGSVVVGFPPDGTARMSVSSDNSIAFDRLKPGEQRTLVVAFTPTQPGRLLPGIHSSIPLEIKVSAAGSTCPSESRSLAVAPVPHLHDMQKAAVGLVAAVLIPLFLEWSVRRRSSRRPSGDDQRRAAPNATTAER